MAEKEFKSPDEIADILFERLKDSEGVKEFLAEGPTAYHQFFGMSVRNEFLLWDKDNPHTMKNHKPELKDNVDYSSKHPDNVSGRILEMLHTKIKRYKEK